VVIQVEDAPHARSQLPGWVVGYGLIHVKPVSETAPTQRQENPNIVVQSPPEPELLARLPPLSRKWGGAAAAIAVWMHEGQPASVCAAAAVTESFWDVGIETQAEYRRRGYGRTCFEALEHRMAEKGKRPIWGADKKNSASLAMARRLGFEPIDEVVVLAKEL
jgi:GNAT superfamily N-acetyltransferase